MDQVTQPKKTWAERWRADDPASAQASTPIAAPGLGTISLGKIAFGVFLGNLMFAILAALVYAVIR